MELMYVQRKIEEVMKNLENVDCVTIKNKKNFIENQKKINRAYILLDRFKDEIIKERTINKLEKQK